jgi:hypothetical protein
MRATPFCTDATRTEVTVNPMRPAILPARQINQLRQYHNFVIFRLDLRKALFRLHLNTSVRKKDPGGMTCGRTSTAAVYFKMGEKTA